MNALETDSGTLTGPRSIPAPGGPEAEAQALLNCGRAPCPIHDRLCAFHGDESGRCPFCHAAWWSVLRAPNLHTCEKASGWAPPDRWRTTGAERLRNAAENSPRADVAPFCSHLGKDAGKPSRAETQPLRGSAGIAAMECGKCSRRFGVMVEVVALARCCGQAARFLGAPEDRGLPVSSREAAWNDRVGAANVRKAYAAIG